MERFGFVLKLFVLLLLGVAANAFIAGKFDQKAISPPRNRRSSGNGVATIVKFHVTSRITTRYARAHVTSVVRNDDEVAKEVSVEIRLPKSAFISNFSMEIEGNVYVGKVKEKSVAKAEYQKAVSRGQSAGLVKANTRESQTFDVSVNVAAGGNVTFRLDYQELLKRKLGVYNHVIYADPGQIVDDFHIEVHISEPSGITHVESENSLDLGRDVRIRRSATQAYLSYRPTKAEQTKLEQFGIKYDVTREQLGGDLLIRNGYFVHFFAPNHLPVIPKKIVFVIDTSGSMSGTKLAQTKQALLTILDDLSAQDQFNIITFSTEARSWQDGELVSVNQHNIARAKSHVNQVHASGGTNLDQAAQEGIALLESVSLNQTNSLEAAGMMILLTDGQPTNGFTNTRTIRQRLSERVDGRYSVFCLGFGSSVDHKFLKQLASENQGLSRRIYEDSDAALQLKGFYDEVASPMLAHVIINYTGTPVVDVSKTTFDNFFDGSEITVVGRYTKNPIPPPNGEVLGALVGGDSVDGKVTLVTHSEDIEETFVDEGFSMEKIWAYLTVKQLLREKKFASDERKEEIDVRVLELSMTHNFVTELTSMVVIKPEKSALPRESSAIGDAPFSASPVSFSYPLGRFGQSRGRSRGRSHAPIRVSSGISRHRLTSLLRSRGPLLDNPVAGPFSLPAMDSPTSGGSGSRLKSSRKNSRNRYRSPRRGKARKRKRKRGKGRYNQSKAVTVETHTVVREQIEETTPLVQETTPEISISTFRPLSSTFQPSQPVRTCGDDIKINSSLNVTSPQHPGLYPPNSRCVWNFTKNDFGVARSTRLKLTFESLDIEEDDGCSRDQVLVYPDFDIAHSNRENHTFCGFNSTPTVVTGRDQLLVVFQSDDVVQGRGFVINLQVEDFLV